jgi:hypothetical protein
MDETAGSTFLDLLRRARDGDGEARLHAHAALYSALHRARRRERPTATRAYLEGAVAELLGGARLPDELRTECAMLAARALRQTLLDSARKRRVARLGSAGMKPVLGGSLDEAMALLSRPEDELVAVDALLTRLALIDVRLARVVELKVFAGLGDGEVSTLLEMPMLGVKRALRVAKALLFDALTQAGKP